VEKTFYVYHVGGQKTEYVIKAKSLGEAQEKFAQYLVGLGYIQPITTTNTGLIFVTSEDKEYFFIFCIRQATVIE
jgi:hypothetical protein